MKQYIETILAPRLQADGGWVEYESYEDGRLTLIFRGECSKCQVLSRCTGWMAGQIKRDLGETVTIEAVRRKPFFWDKD